MVGSADGTVERLRPGRLARATGKDGSDCTGGGGGSALEAAAPCPRRLQAAT